MSDLERHLEYQGLLRAVLEQPLDDTPRLVMADWFDEHGEGWSAEFIRVQCELAKTPKTVTLRAGTVVAGQGILLHDCEVHNPRRAALEIREQELLPGDRLYLPSSRDDYDYLTATVRRGFVESVAGARDDFMRHAAELFRLQPVLEVRLSDRQPWLPLTSAGPAEVSWWFDVEVPGEPESAKLPYELLRRLRRAAFNNNERPRAAVYRTARAAVPLADLSRACVAYGRKLAGLPEVEDPSTVPVV